MTERPASGVQTVGSYELWFIAHLTMGVVYIGGAMFLLPPFALSLPGSTPGDVGVVMAVLPLIGLGAPLVGSLLESYGSYRLFQTIGLGLFAIAFGVLAVVEELIGTTLGALILGVGAALVATSNLSLMAGSGLPDEVRNRRMALLQMSIPMGQFIGLLVVAGLLLLDVQYGGIFLAMGLLALIGMAVTWTTAGPAERRALAMATSRAEPASGEPAAGKPGSGGFLAILLSSFGLVLLVVLLSMGAHSAIESQYANFMADVFGIDGETAAFALSVAVLISVPLYPLVGRWIATTPYRVPLLVGIAVRGLAGLALWLLADMADLPAVVPLALYGAIMVVIPLTDVTGAILSSGTSPIGPAGGQGGFGFALAAAAIGGAFVAGWVASDLGFAQVALAVFVLAALAFGLGLLVPSLRSRSSPAGAADGAP